MKSLFTWTERRLLRLFRKLSNRQNFHLKAEMFSFHSKYFVYWELKRAPQKLSFCFKCPDTGTVRILGNILYSNSPFAVHYYRPMLRNTKQSWILDPIPWIVDSGCWIPIFFQWNVDSGFHALVGFWSTWALFWIPKSWIPDTTSKIQARISQILESGYPYMGRSTSQTFSDLFTLI